MAPEGVILVIALFTVSFRMPTQLDIYVTYDRNTFMYFLRNKTAKFAVLRSIADFLALLLLSQGIEPNPGPLSSGVISDDVWSKKRRPYETQERPLFADLSKTREEEILARIRRRRVAYTRLLASGTSKGDNLYSLSSTSIDSLSTNGPLTDDELGLVSSGSDSSLSTTGPLTDDELGLNSFSSDLEFAADINVDVSSLRYTKLTYDEIVNTPFRPARKSPSLNTRPRSSRLKYEDFDINTRRRSRSCLERHADILAKPRRRPSSSSRVPKNDDSLNRPRGRPSSSLSKSNDSRVEAWVHSVNDVDISKATTRRRVVKFDDHVTKIAPRFTDSGFSSMPPSSPAMSNQYSDYSPIAEQSTRVASDEVITDNYGNLTKAETINMQYSHDWVYSQQQPYYPSMDVSYHTSSYRSEDYGPLSVASVSSRYSKIKDRDVANMLARYEATRSVQLPTEAVLNKCTNVSSTKPENESACEVKSDIVSTPCAKLNNEETNMPTRRYLEFLKPTPLALCNDYEEYVTIRDDKHASVAKNELDAYQSFELTNTVDTTATESSSRQYPPEEEAQESFITTNDDVSIKSSIEQPDADASVKVLDENCRTEESVVIQKDDVKNTDEQDSVSQHGVDSKKYSEVFPDSCQDKVIDVAKAEVDLSSVELSDTVDRHNTDETVADDTLTEVAEEIEIVSATSLNDVKETLERAEVDKKESHTEPVSTCETDVMEKIEQCQPSAKCTDDNIKESVEKDVSSSTYHNMDVVVDDNEVKEPTRQDPPHSESSTSSSSSSSADDDFRFSNSIGHANNIDTSSESNRFKGNCKPLSNSLSKKNEDKSTDSNKSKINSRNKSKDQRISNNSLSSRASTYSSNIADVRITSKISSSVSDSFSSKSSSYSKSSISQSTTDKSTTDNNKRKKRYSKLASSKTINNNYSSSSDEDVSKTGDSASRERTSRKSKTSSTNRKTRSSEQSNKDIHKSRSDKSHDNIKPKDNSNKSSNDSHFGCLSGGISSTTSNTNNTKSVSHEVTLNKMPSNGGELSRSVSKKVHSIVVSSGSLDKSKRSSEGVSAQHSDNKPATVVRSDVDNSNVVPDLKHDVKDEKSNHRSESDMIEKPLDHKDVSKVQEKKSTCKSEENDKCPSENANQDKIANILKEICPARRAVEPINQGEIVRNNKLPSLEVKQAAPKPKAKKKKKKRVRLKRSELDPNIQYAPQNDDTTIESDWDWDDLKPDKNKDKSANVNNADDLSKPIKDDRSSDINKSIDANDVSDDNKTIDITIGYITTKSPDASNNVSVTKDPTIDMCLTEEVSEQVKEDHDVVQSSSENNACLAVKSNDVDSEQRDIASINSSEKKSVCPIAALSVTSHSSKSESLSTPTLSQATPIKAQQSLSSTDSLSTHSSANKSCLSTKPKSSCTATSSKGTPAKVKHSTSSNESERTTTSSKAHPDSRSTCPSHKAHPDSCSTCISPKAHPESCSTCLSPKAHPESCSTCLSPKAHPDSCSTCLSPKAHPDSCSTCLSPKAHPDSCSTCPSPKAHPDSCSTCPSPKAQRSYTTTESLSSKLSPKAHTESCSTCPLPKAQRSYPASESHGTKTTTKEDHSYTSAESQSTCSSSQVTSSPSKPFVLRSIESLGDCPSKDNDDEKIDALPSENKVAVRISSDEGSSTSSISDHAAPAKDSDVVIPSKLLSTTKNESMSFLKSGVSPRRRGSNNNCPASGSNDSGSSDDKSKNDDNPAEIMVRARPNDNNIQYAPQDDDTDIESDWDDDDLPNPANNGEHIEGSVKNDENKETAANSTEDKIKDKVLGACKDDISVSVETKEATGDNKVCYEKLKCGDSFFETLLKNDEHESPRRSVNFAEYNEVLHFTKGSSQSDSIDSSSSTSDDIAQWSTTESEESLPLDNCNTDNIGKNNTNDQRQAKAASSVLSNKASRKDFVINVAESLLKSLVKESLQVPASLKHEHDTDSLQAASEDSTSSDDSSHESLSENPTKHTSVAEPTPFGLTVNRKMFVINYTESLLSSMITDCVMEHKAAKAVVPTAALLDTCECLPSHESIEKCCPQEAALVDEQKSATESYSSDFSEANSSISQDSSEKSVSSEASLNKSMSEKCEASEDSSQESLPKESEVSEASSLESVSDKSNVTAASSQETMSEQAEDTKASSQESSPVEDKYVSPYDLINCPVIETANKIPPNNKSILVRRGINIAESIFQSIVNHLLDDASGKNNPPIQPDADAVDDESYLPVDVSEAYSKEAMSDNSEVSEANSQESSSECSALLENQNIDDNSNDVNLPTEEVTMSIHANNSLIASRRKMFGINLAESLMHSALAEVITERQVVAAFSTPVEETDKPHENDLTKSQDDDIATSVVNVDTQLSDVEHQSSSCSIHTEIDNTDCDVDSNLDDSHHDDTPTVPVDNSNDLSLPVEDVAMSMHANNSPIASRRKMFGINLAESLMHSVLAEVMSERQVVAAFSKPVEATDKSHENDLNKPQDDYLATPVINDDTQLSDVEHQSSSCSIHADIDVSEVDCNRNDCPHDDTSTVPANNSNDVCLPTEEVAMSMHANNSPIASRRKMFGINLAESVMHSVIADVMSERQVVEAVNDTDEETLNQPQDRDVTTPSSDNDVSKSNGAVVISKNESLPTKDVEMDMHANKSSISSRKLLSINLADSILNSLMSEPLTNRLAAADVTQRVPSLNESHGKPSSASEQSQSVSADETQKLPPKTGPDINDATVSEQSIVSTEQALEDERQQSKKTNDITASMENCITDKEPIISAKLSNALDETVDETQTEQSVSSKDIETSSYTSRDIKDEPPSSKIDLNLADSLLKSLFTDKARPNAAEIVDSENKQLKKMLDTLYAYVTGSDDEDAQENDDTQDGKPETELNKSVLNVTTEKTSKQEFNTDTNETEHTPKPDGDVGREELPEPFVKTIDPCTRVCADNKYEKSADCTEDITANEDKTDEVNTKHEIPDPLKKSDSNAQLANDVEQAVPKPDGVIDEEELSVPNENREEPDVDIIVDDSSKPSVDSTENMTSNETEPITSKPDDANDDESDSSLSSNENGITIEAKQTPNVSEHEIEESEIPDVSLNNSDASDNEKSESISGSATSFHVASNIEQSSPYQNQPNSVIDMDLADSLLKSLFTDNARPNATEIVGSENEQLKKVLNTLYAYDTGSDDEDAPGSDDTKDDKPETELNKSDVNVTAEENSQLNSDANDMELALLVNKPETITDDIADNQSQLTTESTENSTTSETVINTEKQYGGDAKEKSPEPLDNAGSDVDVSSDESSESSTNSVNNSTASETPVSNKTENDIKNHRDDKQIEQILIRSNSDDDVSDKSASNMHANIETATNEQGLNNHECKGKEFEHEELVSNNQDAEDGDAEQHQSLDKVPKIDAAVDETIEVSDSSSISSFNELTEEDELTSEIKAPDVDAVVDEIIDVSDSSSISSCNELTEEDKMTTEIRAPKLDAAVDEIIEVSDSSSISSCNKLTEEDKMTTEIRAPELDAAVDEIIEVSDSSSISSCNELTEEDKMTTEIRAPEIDAAVDEIIEVSDSSSISSCNESTTEDEGMSQVKVSEVDAAGDEIIELSESSTVSSPNESEDDTTSISTTKDASQVQDKPDNDATKPQSDNSVTSLSSASSTDVETSTWSTGDNSSIQDISDDEPANPYCGKSDTSLSTLSSSEDDVTSAWSTNDACTSHQGMSTYNPLTPAQSSESDSSIDNSVQAITPDNDREMSYCDSDLELVSDLGSSDHSPSVTSISSSGTNCQLSSSINDEVQKTFSQSMLHKEIDNINPDLESVSDIDLPDDSLSGSPSEDSLTLTSCSSTNGTSVSSIKESDTSTSTSETSLQFIGRSKPILITQQALDVDTDEDSGGIDSDNVDSDTSLDLHPDDSVSSSSLASDSVRSVDNEVQKTLEVYVTTKQMSTDNNNSLAKSPDDSDEPGVNDELQNVKDTETRETSIDVSVTDVSLPSTDETATSAYPHLDAIEKIVSRLADNCKRKMRSKSKRRHNKIQNDTRHVVLKDHNTQTTTPSMIDNGTQSQTNVKIDNTIPVCLKDNTTQTTTPLLVEKGTQSSASVRKASPKHDRSNVSTPEAVPNSSNTVAKCKASPCKRTGKHLRQVTYLKQLDPPKAHKSQVLPAQQTGKLSSKVVYESTKGRQAYVEMISEDMETEPGLNVHQNNQQSTKIVYESIKSNRAYTEMISQTTETRPEQNMNSIVQAVMLKLMPSVSPQVMCFETRTPPMVHSVDEGTQYSPKESPAPCRFIKNPGSKFEPLNQTQRCDRQPDKMTDHSIVKKRVSETAASTRRVTKKRTKQSESCEVKSHTENRNIKKFPRMGISSTTKVIEAGTRNDFSTSTAGTRRQKSRRDNMTNNLGNKSNNAVKRPYYMLDKKEYNGSSSKLESSSNKKDSNPPKKIEKKVRFAHDLPTYKRQKDGDPHIDITSESLPVIAPTKTLICSDEYIQRTVRSARDLPSYKRQPVKTCAPHLDTKTESLPVIAQTETLRCSNKHIRQQQEADPSQRKQMGKQRLRRDNQK